MSIDLEAIEARQRLVTPLLPLTYDQMTDYDRDDAGEVIEYVLAAGVRTGTGEYLSYVDEPSPAQCTLMEVAAHAPTDIAALLAEVKALRLLVGDFEQHVNASVSGTTVGIMTWLDLITRAQRTLEG